jgi:single-stranded-DNA-specific exonuclease
MRGIALPRVAKSWRLLAHDREAIQGLATALRVPPAVAQLLWNRGSRDPDSAKRFFDTSLRILHPPELLPGIEMAAERLIQAIRDKKRICIYGDYDVDGAAGTAILWRTFVSLGAETTYYVPHRLDEGYGLNSRAVEEIAQTSQVLVTVDCGIANVAEVALARSLGLEVIVTDHHEFAATLPDATAIVHPLLPGTGYPFTGLSGAGVALKLAWAVCQRAAGSARVTPVFREFLLDAVVLACLGLIADVVPLHDENRAMVVHGLKRLREAPSPGLKALLEVSKLTEKDPLRAEDVSFKLAPRLNAAGRLGSARLVVELLTTQSPHRAGELARFLEDLNGRRQQAERKILARAREIVEEREWHTSSALVLAEPDWHPGIIGIVASRLVDLYGRPVLMVALRADRIKEQVIGQGSGRSVPGFALHQALAACSEHLLSHGGHAAAAGFTVVPDNIDALRDAFATYAGRHFEKAPLIQELIVEAELPLSAMTTGFVRSLDRLEPFGMGNRRPCFLAGGLQVVEPPKKVGNGERHLSFRVRQDNVSYRAIAWGMADRAEELPAGGPCSLVFTPRLNEWKGFIRVDLEVIDFQPREIPELALTRKE